MPKALDLVDKTFDWLTVLKRNGSDSRGNALWECQCKCGAIIQKSTKRLRENNKFHSCGCATKRSSIIYTKQKIENEHPKFNYLTVLKVTQEGQGYNRLVECQCDCGTKIIVPWEGVRLGTVISCGCITKLDLKYIGQTYGELTVIARDYNYVKEKNLLDNRPYWKCQCSCGEIITVSSHELNNGNKTSCGCIPSNKIKDLRGEKFGLLTPIRIDIHASYNASGSAYWLCQCDCGQLKTVSSQNLQNGKVVSCGCLSISFGEYIIQSILDHNHIPYVKQKTFDTCRSDKHALLKFDFYIDNKFLLEYDGEQHYHAGGLFYTNEIVKEIQKRDEIKNQWCLQNNIFLKRIPYTKRNITLEDIMGDKFLIKENTNE